MKLSDYLANYKDKQYFTNMKMSPTTLGQNTLKQKGFTQCAFVPHLADHSFDKRINEQNLDNRTQMHLFRKALDQQQNHCEGLTQWSFGTLGPTISYTPTNLKNLECLP